MRNLAFAEANHRGFLLTATPIENRVEELYNLVTLLRPGTLGNAGEFRRTHVARGDKRMPRNPQGLGRLLRQVMVRTRREDTAIPFPRRTAETVIVALTPEERALYDDVTRSFGQIFVVGAEAFPNELAFDSEDGIVNLVG